MPETAPSPAPPPITLPALSALAVNTREAALLTEDGEVKILPHGRGSMELHKRAVLVCHGPYTRARLGERIDIHACDVLELFAFVHPARFCVPTPAGLANALGLTPPDTLEDAPFTLMESAQALLTDLQREPLKEKGLNALEIARAMGKNGKGWAWAPSICAALGTEYDPSRPIAAKSTFNVWRYLPEWSEDAPPPPPSHHGVSEDESTERLQSLLAPGAEERAAQKEYAAKITAAFAPIAEENKPHTILAEAGTGVGKTLGYLAPASVWAEKNDGPVWVATYTKNLQRQIDQELDRVFPNPELKDNKVTIRKGRENYLCLLNLEDMVAGAALAKYPQQIIAAGIMARWAEATKSGDLQGGDFPGWLPGLLGHPHTTGLADRRGECVFSACDHYHKCFIERSIRKARRADIVIANHALVMIKAVISGPDDPLPQRFIFDEAHHLFDAADSAFAGHLTARETHDLRRWIRGAEGGRQSRARGLKRRIEDLIAGDNEAENEMEAIFHEARTLPAHGWSRRLRDKNPDGPTEKFLALVYNQVHARTHDAHTPYSLETETHPLIDGLADAANLLHNKFKNLQKPMHRLSSILRKKLADQSDTLNSDTRKRMEAMANGLDRRADHTLAGWISMLESLQQPKNESSTFIDWFEIDRIDGKAHDIGYYRHWVDPMIPFSKAIAPFAHGIAMTSATLCDGEGENRDENWETADLRTGALKLTDTPQHFSIPSPFNYEEQTRVFIISDVNKNDVNQLAGAYRALFEAAGGGGLGLFTAINRLRAVQGQIAGPLEEKGLHLYAQHIDQIDTGTLVDIFREDIHACLLGTDAVRDGVDVPGESLRLLVYDRVPWPRPTILHKARREAFGGRAFDEMTTRLKLRQAFGRLIRKSDDRGVFVMLDSALPTKLLDAFPPGAPVSRIGLAECTAEIRRFYKI
ncbi:MAG: ATP-dependent DNA helicase [Rhodospirillales bacterium]|nr:ATP-dependent DNA helicase [Rhodospirillales bacterium]